MTGNRVIRFATAAVVCAVAAVAAVAASVAAGVPLSQRAMSERFGLSRSRVSQLVTQVTVSGNGHLPGKEVA